MLSLIEDLRAAWRSLLKAPGFLAAASGVLALGLGTTIFMYGVIVTTVVRPPPFEQAERLNQLMAGQRAGAATDARMGYLDYLDIKSAQRSFSDLAAYYESTFVISGDGLPERYAGAFVSHDYLRLLRVKPVLGRDFTQNDDLPNAAPVAIIGYDLWRTRFNGDPGVVGRTVRMNSRTATVVGVAPAGFKFPQREVIWVPMAADPASMSRENALQTSVLGRLGEGVSADRATAELAVIAKRLGESYPKTNAGMTLALLPIARTAVGVDGAKLLYTVFYAVWLVLLIACANAGSLIFVRANFRAYEASIRVAMGARRSRLIVQMLAESIVVSSIGVLGGLALAAVALYSLQEALPSVLGTDPPSWWRFTIDTRVVVFSGLAAVGAGMLAGIVPAIRAARPDVMRILRDGGRTGTGMNLSRFTTIMVIIELCMSAMLLTTATYLSRNSFVSLQGNFGADVRGFMTGRVSLPPATYTPEEQGRFFERVVQDLGSRPGVRSATAAEAMPGTGSDAEPYALEGKDYRGRGDLPMGQVIRVVPGFFRAFERPVLRGRDFDSRDRSNTPPVAIVNEAFVRAHFPSKDPLGTRVRLTPQDPSAPWLTVIAVVSDIQHDIKWSAGGAFSPTIYVPVSQQPVRSLAIAVKGAGAPADQARLIREAVRSIDPDLAVFWMRTIEEHQAIARGGFRVLAAVLVVFAGIAIVLAGVGVYSVLAFSMLQRSREIGVRRALGARNGQILAAVARGAAFQLSIGLGLGLLLAPFLPHILGDALSGVRPDDPVTYTLVFSMLILTAALASWIPAMRAVRVDPAMSLRDQ